MGSKTNDKEQLIIIEKYINGQLSVQERADFEKRLQSDPSLARKTSSYRNSFANHLSAGGSKLKDGIIAVGKKGGILSKRMIELNQKKRLVKAVGVILIISIAFVMVYFIFDSTPDYVALYNQYYTESISEHPLLKDNELEEVNGITHYQNRDFSRAIPALEKDLIAMPGDARLYLYLGLAYLESDNYAKAKLNFEKAETLSDGKYRASSLWYLSLAQIRLNQIPLAKEHLIAIANQTENNPFKHRARKLLNEL